MNRLRLILMVSPAMLCLMCTGRVDHEAQQAPAAVDVHDASGVDHPCVDHAKYCANDPCSSCCCNPALIPEQPVAVGGCAYRYPAEVCDGAVPKGMAKVAFESDGQSTEVYEVDDSSHCEGSEPCHG